MTQTFSAQRQKISDELELLLACVQQQLDAAGETKVNAHDLILETAIKMALEVLDKSKFAFVLRRYSEMVVDGELTATMDDDDMPDPE